MDINKVLEHEVKQKVVNPQEAEARMRNSVLSLARAQGEDKYQEAVNILNRYDKILRNCTNVGEKRHIAIMGIAELHRLLNCKGSLVVNGVEILPDISIDGGLSKVTW